MCGYFHVPSPLSLSSAPLNSRHVSPSPPLRPGRSTDTTKIIKLIEAQTLKLERLNALEGQLNDDLIASLHVDKRARKKSIRPDRQDGRPCHTQRPGWHLVAQEIVEPEACGSSDDGVSDSDEDDAKPTVNVTK